MKKETKEELSILRHIPNLLTISRILLTFVVAYLILTQNKLSLIVVVFVIAALTDYFDGVLARKFNWTSEFGRKADIIADRFLWIGTALSFFIAMRDVLTWKTGLQLAFIMSREIITAPFALVSFFGGKSIP